MKIVVQTISKFLSIVGLTSLLIACGGGGSGGGEEPFSATISVGASTHVCKSEEALQDCYQGECSACKCLNGCAAGPGEVIQQACTFFGDVSRVSSAGCTLATEVRRTLVCSNNRLYVREGSGYIYTREQVLEGTVYDAPWPANVASFNFRCDRIPNLHF